jgi:predicted TIM-barrel fold metal-dependent hydrolase
LKLIDSHLHFNAAHPEQLAVLKDLDIKLLNICGVWEADKSWADQREVYRSLAERDPQHFAWCTTFDLPRFNDPHYVRDVIAGLKKDFDAGACSVKVWKNLGMEGKKPDGSWFTVDDPLLSPIFDFIAEQNKTLLMHIAEPRICWRPLVKGAPHYGYFSAFPQWHMYGKPGVLSHEELIASRDNVAARHPKLRCVGAHLGSLEYDTDHLAQRLRQYPNFAVDTSARLSDLMIQDSEKVRKFFIEFQDRIMFGTDFGSFDDPFRLKPDQLARTCRDYRANVQAWLSYLTSNERVTDAGYTAQGLNLPPEVNEKVCYTNVLKWYPGF